MIEILHFTGFIKGVKYKTYLAEILEKVNWNEFDINQIAKSGLIKFPITEIAYSQWVSPKRSRSYPFARIYNTYDASKVITVIPVVKDEGKEGMEIEIKFNILQFLG